MTPEKKIAWEFTAAELPEVNLTWASSIQRLENGNVVIGNFLRGQEGKGVHVFQVMPEKRVVWKPEDHSRVQSLTTVRVLE